MIVLKRTLEMKVRFTKTELDALTKKARKSGLSREGYCRRVLNGTARRCTCADPGGAARGE
jgi:predicted DNA binding CopG/RHH family protein